MSVVNKMLRDLENRQHSPQASANYVPPHTSKKLWVGLSTGVFFALCVAGYNLAPSNSNIDRPGKQDSSSSFDPEKGDQFVQNNIQNIEQASRQDNRQSPNQDSARVANQKIVQALNKAIVQEPIRLVEAPALLNISAHSLEKPASVKPQFKVQASDGSAAELSSLRALAYLASQQGNDAKVISLLHQILVLDGSEIRTRKQLAALLFSKSKFTEAQDVLSAGLKQTPEDSSLRLMLSRIHFKVGNNFDAFNVLIQHPYNQLANDELLSFRAALAEKIGEYEVAQQDYQLLVQRNPNEAKWWLGLGVSQDKQRLSKQAMGSYLQAQQLNQLPAQVETFVEQRIQLLARRS